MSGIGIELSSTTIKVVYNLDNEIIGLQLKQVMDSQDTSIFPILYPGSKPEIDAEASERLVSQPEDVITNIVYGMEIMENQDREKLAQKVEWGSPVTFEDGSFSYHIKSKDKEISISDTIQCIFNIIQNICAHIPKIQNKAVITVPPTFGKSATSIVEQAASLFGTFAVIPHDLSALYSNNITNGASLVICCGEYFSTVSFHLGLNCVESRSFSDMDFPRELFSFLQSHPSTSAESAAQLNDAALYAQARLLAFRVMRNSLFGPLDRFFCFSPRSDE